MQFESSTLAATASFVAAVSGFFVFFSWRRYRDSQGALWWASALAVQALGVALMLASFAYGSRALAVAAAATLILAAGLFWTAARAFNRRPTPHLAIPAGAILLVLLSPLADTMPRMLEGMSLAITAIYFAGALVAFWRGRDERLAARWPLIALIAIHTAVVAIGAVEALIGVLPPGETASLASWYGISRIELIVFSVGSAVFVVAFVRERLEVGHKIAAATDTLTGVANRRAFVEYCEVVLANGGGAGDTLSLIVFDLDRFKSINDTCGHAVGDQVLKQFGTVARAVLRSSDLIGRLGGEEFAVILPGANLATALRVAERIRTNFAAACHTVDGHAIAATVSAGVATSDGRSSLEVMLAEADKCLYRAKSSGRDRVESGVPRKYSVRLGGVA